MESIKLSLRHNHQLGSEQWYATTDNPTTKELFGTDTIPTAYSGQMPCGEVLARVKALNPDCNVSVK